MAANSLGHREAGHQDKTSCGPLGSVCYYTSCSLGTPHATLQSDMG